MIREELKNLVKQALPPEVSDIEIDIEQPENKEFGDYSTNVAMKIAKILKKNPLEIAEDLKSKITSDFFEKIEVAKPGFINFYLAEEYLQQQVGEILEQVEKFGQLKIGQGKKIQVEFISANPTGLLHIGNGRGAFFGHVLVNLLSKAGYQVEREYFIQDAKEGNQIKELGKTALGQGVTYLNDYLKSKIEKIKPKLSRIKDPAEAGFLLAQIIQEDIQEFIEKKLKIKFNTWFSEQELYEQNQVEKTFQQLREKDLTYEKEGAIWLKTTKFGDSQDRVLIRATGAPTYLLPDIAYHLNKFQRNFDRVINIWGADHQGHIKPLKIGLNTLGCQKPIDFLISQMVRLKGGKISKRKGQVINLEWLIDEVGLDVARFFYLIKSLDTQMEFDLDLAKEQSEKNPVFYIQYAYARISSILRKAKSSKFQLPSSKILNHPTELELIRQLIKFPEIIEDATRDYQVQRMPHYALELVTAFHKFYENCRVISEDKKITQARLGLVEATRIVLKNTLDLMGISAPEKM